MPGHCYQVSGAAPGTWGLGGAAGPVFAGSREAELWTPELTGCEESPESWVGPPGSPTAPHHVRLSLWLAGRWRPRLGPHIRGGMALPFGSYVIVCVCVCAWGERAWGSGTELRGSGLSL